MLEVDASVGWDRLWDAALDLGVKYIRGLQSLGQVASDMSSLERRLALLTL